MRRTILLLSLFFVLGHVSAQNLPENYTKAKSALSTQDYWSSINLFKEFLDESKYGSLSYYAAFHTAEAALKVNQPSLAIESLRPVYGKTWDQSDEMIYLLAVAYFQNSQPLDGLRMIKQLKSEAILTKAYNASFEFLKGATPSFLITNLEEFKTNEGYTAAVAKVLEEKAVMSASERMALNQVLKSGVKGLPKDEILDLVVILPFTNSSSQAISSLGATDFMLEFYQGIEAGVKQLKAQGVQDALVFTSAWCRCKETADKLGLSVPVQETSLNSFFDDMRQGPQSNVRLQKFIAAQLKSKGDKALILVTHHVNIAELMGENVGSGDMVLVKVNSQGQRISHKVYPSPS